MPNYLKRLNCNTQTLKTLTNNFDWLNYFKILFSFCDCYLKSEVIINITLLLFEMFLRIFKDVCNPQFIVLEHAIPKNKFRCSFADVPMKRLMVVDIQLELFKINQYTLTNTIVFDNRGAAKHLTTTKWV